MTEHVAPSYDELRRQLQESMQRVLDAAIYSLRSALEFLEKLPWWGFMLVNRRFTDELRSWGVPEPAARWITWHLPYGYVHLVVRMLRHDRALRAKPL